MMYYIAYVSRENVCWSVSELFAPIILAVRSTLAVFDLPRTVITAVVYVIQRTGIYLVYCVCMHTN